MAYKKHPLSSHTTFLGFISLATGIGGILFFTVVASQSLNPYTNSSTASNPHPLNLTVSVSRVGNAQNVKVIAGWLKYKSETYQYFLNQSAPSAKIIKSGYTGNNQLELVQPLTLGSYTFTVRCFRNEGRNPSSCPENTSDAVTFTYTGVSAPLSP